MLVVSVSVHGELNASFGGEREGLLVSNSVCGPQVLVESASVGLVVSASIGGERACRYE